MIYTLIKIILNKNMISVVKLGEDYVAPVSALPLGSSRKVGITGIMEVDLKEGAVLAISHSGEKEEITTAPVSGFIVCVDEKKGRVLACQPKLPKCSYLIQSNLNYIDY